MKTRCLRIRLTQSGHESVAKKFAHLGDRGVVAVACERRVPIRRRFAEGGHLHRFAKEGLDRGHSGSWRPYVVAEAIGPHAELTVAAVDPILEQSAVSFRQAEV